MNKFFTAPRQFMLPAVAVALLVSACSMIPAYERPAAPVAVTYPSPAGSTKKADPANALAAPSASTIAWQTFFTDTRLQRLIELALINNRDLRVAVLNIEQARAQYQIRRADQFPTINGVLGGSRTPSASGGVTSLYSAGLQATAYELDFFGRVSSLKEAALNQYLATEEGRKTAQITLIASVANAYLSLLADDELLEVTRQTLVTREESIRLSKLRFDNGVASELDFRQAESLVEAARVSLAQQQRQRALDENLLTLLVGSPLAVELPAAASTAAASTSVAAPLAQMQPLVDVPAGLPSELLANRPDIRQAERQLLAANANIGAARAAFFPRIALTAGAGSASNQLAGLFKSGSWGLTFAPSLTLPIFDAGRNQANLEVSKVTRDIAVAQYEKAIQSAFREVADALASRSTLAEQLRASQAQANAESIRFRLSDLRYRNGVSSYLDLLDAQRSLFAARQAVVQTRLAQLQSQVGLYRALGGGWTEPADVKVNQGEKPVARP